MTAVNCLLANDETALWLSCALCGMRFRSVGSVCGACPLSRGCDLARCPNCGYQFPRGSRVLEWIRRGLNAARRRNS